MGLQSMMLRPLAGAGFGVPWRGPAFAQDATSLLVAPMTNLPAGAHDSTGGWMTGGPAGRHCSAVTGRFRVLCLERQASVHNTAYLISA